MPDAGGETIMVVDDDESIRTYLNEVLTDRGYQCQTFADGLSALRWLSTGDAHHADMLLSDISMPGMSGMELLRTLKAVAPDLPVILLSGLCDLALATDAMRAGATDYLLKPAAPDALMTLIVKHLDRNRLSHMRPAREALRHVLKHKSLSGGSDASQLLPFFELLGLKRLETLQHSRRVAAFSVLLGERMGFDAIHLEALEIGSLLHDVGKSGIPYNILAKPGKLDAEERRIMEMHPELGAAMLAKIPGMELEAQIVFSHHERFDGKGYPRRLAGQQIPLAARLFAVADTLDSITADRCYRKGRDLSVARTEIVNMSGSQFDPEVVIHFLSLTDKELNDIQTRFPEQEDSPDVPVNSSI